MCLETGQGCQSIAAEQNPLRDRLRLFLDRAVLHVFAEQQSFVDGNAYRQNSYSSHFYSGVGSYSLLQQPL